MQTFLPYADFYRSAKCLDNKRLGKQRVECMQLLKALATGPFQYFDPDIEEWLSLVGEVPLTDEGEPCKTRKTPWYNHPAAQMWLGYEQALTDYAFACIAEWIDRGFKDTCHDKICNIISIWSEDWDPYSAVLPPWLGDEAFHASHRSNLLRKDPVWYGQFSWTESNNLPYIWPTKE